MYININDMWQVIKVFFFVKKRDPGVLKKKRLLKTTWSRDAFVRALGGLPACGSNFGAWRRDFNLQYRILVLASTPLLIPSS